MKQNDLIAFQLPHDRFLARQPVQQHPAGCLAQLFCIILHRRDRGRNAGKHGAVVQAGDPQVVGHEDMPHPQLPHDLKGDLIITTEDAIRFLLQRSFQCINGLSGRFHTGMNQPLVYRYAKFREPTQITARAVGIDRVDGTAHQQCDALGTQLQENAGHLAGGSDLIVVCLRDGLVLAASDKHERRLVLPQKVDAGVVCHGVGQDHAVHLVVSQLPPQLRVLGVGGVA